MLKTILRFKENGNKIHDFCNSLLLIMIIMLIFFIDITKNIKKKQLSTWTLTFGFFCISHFALQQGKRHLLLIIGASFSDRKRLIHRDFPWKVAKTILRFKENGNKIRNFCNLLPSITIIMLIFFIDITKSINEKRLSAWTLTFGFFLSFSLCSSTRKITHFACFCCFSLRR